MLEQFAEDTLKRCMLNAMSNNKRAISITKVLMNLVRTARMLQIDKIFHRRAQSMRHAKVENSMVELSRLALGTIPIIPLINGAPNAHFHFSSGMQVIEAALQSHGSDLVNHWNDQNHGDFIKLAPTCARLMFEQCMAAIVGRMDPVRFLAVYRGSSSPDFGVGLRNPSSFNWNADVFCNPKAPANLWSQDAIGKGLRRSVLDGHLSDYLFHSSHSSVLAELSDATAGLAVVQPYVSRLQGFAETEANGVIGLLRSKANQSYSSLSKGMHFEFFASAATMPNHASVVDAISDAMCVIATVGLYSHFTDFSLHRVSRSQAISDFLVLTERFNCQ